MTYVGGASNINLKNLKIWRHQVYSDGRFEPKNSNRSLSWVYKLKALKSQQQTDLIYF